MGKISVLLHHLFLNKTDPDCKYALGEGYSARAGSASDRPLSPRHHAQRENNDATAEPVLYTRENTLTLLPDYPWHPNNL